MRAVTAQAVAVALMRLEPMGSGTIQGMVVTVKLRVLPALALLAQVAVGQERLILAVKLLGREVPGEVVPVAEQRGQPVQLTPALVEALVVRGGQILVRLAVRVL